MCAAGPASNFLLFLAFGMLVHPAIGLVDPASREQPAWVYFLAAMAVLNFDATVFNLIPLPPFDGYHVIQHRFSPEMQWKLGQPQVAIMTYVGVFFLFGFDQVQGILSFMLIEVSESLGMPVHLFVQGYNFVLFNIAPS